MAKLKVSEYIGLIKAGYTPEEIAAFENDSEDQKFDGTPYPAEQPQPVEDPKPAEQPQPVEQPAPVPAVSQDTAERIEKAVADFTKALQAFNLANARQPGGSVKDPRDEATEILTKFCNM